MQAESKGREMAIGLVEQYKTAAKESAERAAAQVRTAHQREITIMQNHEREQSAFEESVCASAVVSGCGC